MASFLSHFGLSRHPFDKDLLDADLWQPPSQADLVEEAVEALRARESLLLYGECGVGKTCTLRLVRHRLSSDGFRLTYCHHAFLGRRDSKGLKAHHSPDLFHVQHEVCHALCAVLATQVRQAEAAQDKATGALEARRLQEQAWPQQPHGPGRPPNLAGRVAVAQQDAAIAEQEVAAARDRQERARGAVQGLAHAYYYGRTSPTDAAALVEESLRSSVCNG